MELIAGNGQAARLGEALLQPFDKLVAGPRFGVVLDAVGTWVFEEPYGGQASIKVIPRP